ncbi:MAG: cell division protein FtsA, partial [Kiritimatiellae bacterium]|nr:cell division protein FtsA [Kiritimatiellia bacterium]
MNINDPVAALEIGTSRTVLVVGEPLSADRIRVAAVAEIPSIGVRQGQITDVTQAGYSIASVLKRIEKEGGYNVAETALVVSGPQIATQRVTTTWQTDAKTRKVTEEDVAAIYNNSLHDDPASRVLLDATEQGYELDNVGGIDNPVGLTGDLLKLNTLLIHGPKSRLDDQRSAAANAKLAVSDTFFAGSCAAAAVLRAADRAAGALVIDLGGGCTPFTVWSDGKLVLAGVVPVGGDHATNDVQIAFGMSLSQAEELKKRASAILSKDRATGRIELAKSIAATGPDSVSKRALDVVVNARFAELFAI